MTYHYIYIYNIIWDFFQPRSICEREIDFRILQPGSHVARNAGCARARKEERKDICIFFWGSSLYPQTCIRHCYFLICPWNVKELKNSEDTFVAWIPQVGIMSLGQGNASSGDDPIVELVASPWVVCQWFGGPSFHTESTLAPPFWVSLSWLENHGITRFHFREHDLDLVNPLPKTMAQLLSDEQFTLFKCDFKVATRSHPNIANLASELDRLGKSKINVGQRTECNEDYMRQGNMHVLLSHGYLGLSGYQHGMRSPTGCSQHQDAARWIQTSWVSSQFLETGDCSWHPAPPWVMPRFALRCLAVSSSTVLRLVNSWPLFGIKIKSYLPRHGPFRIKQNAWNLHGPPTLQDFAHIVMCLTVAFIGCPNARHTLQGDAHSPSQPGIASEIAFLCKFAMLQGPALSSTMRWSRQIVLQWFNFFACVSSPMV